MITVTQLLLEQLWANWASRFLHVFLGLLNGSLCRQMWASSQDGGDSGPRAIGVLTRGSQHKSLSKQGSSRLAFQGPASEAIGHYFCFALLAKQPLAHPGSRDENIYNPSRDQWLVTPECFPFLNESFACRELSHHCISAVLGTENLSLVYSLLDHKQPHEELNRFWVAKGMYCTQFGGYLSKLHSLLLPQENNSYISHIPLQLRVVMWQNSGQWDVSQSCWMRHPRSLILFVFAAPHSTWDPSSLTRDWSCASCIANSES